jgi:hypothetical protein
MIVKAMSSDVNETGGPFVVHFRGFNNDGIILRITDLRGRPPNALETVTVMVEVSQYVPAN